MTTPIALVFLRASRRIQVDLFLSEEVNLSRDNVVMVLHVTLPLAVT